MKLRMVAFQTISKHPQIKTLLMGLFFCCASLFLSSCGRSNPAGPNPTPYNSGKITGTTYQNDFLQFKITAPTGWSIRLPDSSAADDSTLLAACLKQIPSSPINASMALSVLIVKDSIAGDALIEELSETFLADTSWKTISVDSASVATIGDFNGVWFEVSGERVKPAVSIKVMEFVFRIKSYNVIITALCPLTNFEQEKAAIDASFNSLLELAYL
jgi:hypothetical protein